MTTTIGIPVFDDRYVAKREIGRNGIAVAYAGVDLRLQRRVVITVLSPLTPGDEARAIGCYREAVRSLGLRHPNVVAPYAAGRIGDAYYFASEFVEGRTLAEILEAGESLAPTLVYNYAAQVAGAIAYARAKGAQLDASPKAMYVTAEGVVKIATAFASGCGEGDPNETYSNLDELVEALNSAGAARPPGDGVDATAFMMEALANHFSTESDPVQWSEPPPRRRPVRAILATIPLILLAAGGLAYAATHYTTLPDLGGMRQTEAQETLSSDGFSGNIELRPSDEVLPQHVIAQQPPAGQWVEKGSDVQLIVSSGLPAVSVRHAAPRRVAKSVVRKEPTMPPASIAHASRAPRSVPIARRPAPKPICPSGSLVDIHGYARGCTAISIASRGELLGGAGFASTIPVMSLDRPGRVEYALAYVAAPSRPKRLVGILSGDGYGNLIVRVQNGMFVEQNGSHVRYLTFDGERIVAMQEAPPPIDVNVETSSSAEDLSKCPQPSWVQRTLHKLFNTRAHPCA